MHFQQILTSPVTYTLQPHQCVLPLWIPIAHTAQQHAYLGSISTNPFGVTFPLDSSQKPLFYPHPFTIRTVQLLTL